MAAADFSAAVPPGCPCGSPRRGPRRRSLQV